MYVRGGGGSIPGLEVVVVDGVSEVGKAGLSCYEYLPPVAVLDTSAQGSTYLGR